MSRLPVRGTKNCRWNGVCAQSSLTAVVSTVALVGVLSFSIMQASGISGRVADEARQREAVDIAVAVSNDLLSDPGYNGTSLEWGEHPEHFGLAKYDSEKRVVLDRVLDPAKIAFLQKGGIRLIQEQYGVGNASLRIEAFSGKVLLDAGNFSGSRVQVSRVALVKEGEKYGRVRVVFALGARPAVSS